VSEKKLKLKDGEIAVGQATRYFNLEILSNSSKSLNKGMEEEVVGDSTARFVFSSEYPVLRYDYWEDEAFYEVLSHDPSSVNTQRITKGVCPILWNHNRDWQRGIVKSVNFTDGKASCYVEYDDNEDGKDLCHLVQKGTRSGVSFMYQVHDEYTELPMKEAVALIEKYRLSDKGYYPVRVSKNWEIFEISHVSVPADPTVGVGKSLQRSEKDEPKIIQIKGKNMPPLTTPEIAEMVEAAEETKSKPEAPATEEVKGLDLEAVKNLILKTVTPVRDQNFVLEQEKSQALAENLSLKQELNQEREERLKAQQLADALKDISQLIGRSEVEVLPTTKSASAFTMSQGLAREFIDLFSSSRAKPTEVRHEGMLAVQRDHNVFAKFMHDHFREEAVRGLRDWWTRSLG
jgi:phage head maturation protease